jgi:aspartate carbamoyltransferase catalytic subunit
MQFLLPLDQGFLLSASRQAWEMVPINKRDVSEYENQEVMHMPWTHKDLIDLDNLTAQEIEHILQTALPMKEVLSRPIKKLPTLRGKSIALMFYENSTRTRTSFETAAKILGADITNFSVAQSSVNKGESLLDTAKTLQAMNIDLVIIRHSSSGASEFLAQQLKAGVINGGDGQHAIPRRLCWIILQ